LNRLDLNLFRVFSVIYRERNLTRAAEQLSVSQSAISHALSRMRQQLQDPLFVREAQGVIPTPMARRIWPDVQQGLVHLRRAFISSDSFEPGRDVKQIRLAMNDVAEPAIVPKILAVLNSQVPGAALSSVRQDRTTMAADLRTGRLDCAIDVALNTDDELKHSLLTRDEFVVVSRSAIPVDEENYLHADHVTVSARPTGRGVEDWELSRLGVTRNVTTRCQHYSTACRLVACSDRLLTMPRSLALDLNAYLGTHLHPLPMDARPISLHLYWHREQDRDPANVWLRQILLGIEYLSRG
jgi:DNA-binding transcriptional LysR family regulator